MINFAETNGKVFGYWKSLEAKDQTPREAAEKVVETLTGDELKHFAKEYIALRFAQTQRTFTTKAEKASTIRFTPQPVVFNTFGPTVPRAGTVARAVYEEKQASAEASRQNEADRAFTLGARTRALTSDYAESYAFEINEKLLSAVIEIGDGTERALGDVTAEEWESRITRGTATVVGNLMTVGREKAYLNTIRTNGVSTLRQVAELGITEVGLT